MVFISPLYDQYPIIFVWTDMEIPKIPVMSFSWENLTYWDLPFHIQWEKMLCSKTMGYRVILSSAKFVPHVNTLIHQKYIANIDIVGRQNHAPYTA